MSEYVRLQELIAPAKVIRCGDRKLKIGSAAEPAGAGDFEEIFDAAVFWLARSGVR